MAAHHPGATQLLPQDRDLAWQVRLCDRFYDLYISTPMQKVVIDRLRPAGQNDPFGVAQAWAAGDDFSMADCAAAPALFYANLVVPFADAQRNVAAYLDRLLARPSFARVVREARPYRALFPGGDQTAASFRSSAAS
jgi:glutathione S-transferase